MTTHIDPRAEHQAAVDHLMSGVDDLLGQYSAKAIVSGCRDEYGINHEDGRTLYWDLMQAIGAERMRCKSIEKERNAA